MDEHEDCTACEHLDAQDIKRATEHIMEQSYRASDEVLSPQVKLDAMRQERDRYKAALEHLVDGLDGGLCRVCEDDTWVLVRDAKRVLEGTDG